jgi:O-antigen/teichoic acid export membrane protein
MVHDLTRCENSISRNEKSQVRKNALLVAYKALADLVSKGSLLLITILAARRLSQEAFGVFSVGSTLGWILAVAADFGIQLHLARAVARRPADAGPLLERWLRVRLWTTAASVGLVVLGLAVSGTGASARLPILLLTIVYACAGLIEFLHYFYRGLSRTDVESSLVVWHRVATLASAAAVLVWRPGLALLTLAMLAPALATLAISLRIAVRLARAQAHEDAVSARLVRFDPLGAELRHEVVPIGLGIVLSALYFRIDIFLIELWRGSSDVALYNAVFRLIEALRLFPAAVLAVVLPALFRAQTGQPVARVSAGLLLFATATTVVLWATAGWLIPLVYGPAYAAAVPAFRILALSFPLLSLNYALTHQLIGWDGQRSYAAICAAALLVNVALNARLIPRLSIDGAAWSTLATEVFLTVACVAALRAIGGRRAALAVSAGAAV